MINPTPIKQNITLNDRLTKIWIRWFELIVETLNKVFQSTVTISVTDSPYTVTTNTFRVVCNTTLGDMVVNYPSGIADASARVVNSGTANNTVTMNSSELIAGETSQILYDDEVYEAIYTVAGGWR